VGGVGEQTSKVLAIKRQGADSHHGQMKNWMLPDNEKVLSFLHAFVGVSAARQKETRTLFLACKRPSKLDFCEVQLQCSHICQGLEHMHRHTVLPP
jgi:hypothetical protein